MQGVSRGALAESRHALQVALQSGASWASLSDELFAVASLLDANPAVRRALADPSREGEARRTLAYQLFGGKVADATTTLVGSVAAARWSSDRDLVDGLEELAVEARLQCADAAGRADDTEEQLFRFERVVAANPQLRDALSDPQLPVERKVGLTDALLAGRAGEETRALVRQLVSNPRGRHFDAGVSRVLAIAARRRDQLTAVATVAAPLTDEQVSRLRGALSSLYGRPILLQTVVDPAVVGGIRVQVGDEVVDGTVTRRLEEARRHMGV